MTPGVNHQGCSLRKFFFAVRALVGLLTRVSSTMDAKIVLRNESLVANVANMRLFAGVLSHVDGQVGFARNGLTTNMADVLVLGNHVPVCLHVHREHLFSAKSLVAELAAVFLLRYHVVGLMKLGVQPQTLPVTKGSLTSLALEGSILRMHQLMFLPVLELVETLATSVTLMLEDFVVPSLMTHQVLFELTSEGAHITCVKLDFFALCEHRVLLILRFVCEG